jgi:hypothetical protein
MDLQEGNSLFQFLLYGIVTKSVTKILELMTLLPVIKQLKPFFQK